MDQAGTRSCWNRFLPAACFTMFVLSVPAAAQEEVSLEARLDSLAAEVRALKQTPTPPASKLKFGGLVQARWETAENSADTIRVSGTSVSTANRNRFAIRRARLKATWEEAGIGKGVFYVNAGDTRAVELLEAYVSLYDPWTEEKRHTLTAGQMNVPFGFDLEYSTSKQELLERSTVERTLFPGERDRGVTLESRWSPQWTTVIGVFNGTTISEDARFTAADPNGGKAVVARVRGTFGPLTAALSGYAAKSAVPLTGPDLEHDKTRLGADAQAAYRNAIGAGGVRAEWIAGRSLNPDSLSALTVNSGGAQLPVAGRDLDHVATDFSGGYVSWFQDFAQRFQAAARWDFFDPNVDLEHDQAQRVSLALHARSGAHLRTSVLYEVVMTDRAAPGGGYEDPPDNRWTIQFQHAF